MLIKRAGRFRWVRARYVALLPSIQNKPGDEANREWLRRTSQGGEWVQTLDDIIVLPGRRQASRYILRTADLLQDPFNWRYIAAVRPDQILIYCMAYAIPFPGPSKSPGIPHSGSFAEVGHAGMRKTFIISFTSLYILLVPSLRPLLTPLSYHLSLLSRNNPLLSLWSDTRSLRQPHLLLIPDGCHPCMITLFWLKVPSLLQLR